MGVCMKKIQFENNNIVELDDDLMNYKNEISVSFNEDKIKLKNKKTEKKCIKEKLVNDYKHIINNESVNFKNFVTDLDEYLFKEGTHMSCYKFMGAHYVTTVVKHEK